VGKARGRARIDSKIFATDRLKDAPFFPGTFTDYPAKQQYSGSGQKPLDRSGAQNI
jgi:hypothetical protein